MNRTPAQNKAIFAIGRGQGLDIESLRDIAFSVSGAASISQLTKDQATEMIRQLTGGEKRERPSRKRHADLDGRKGMATGAQVRKIEAMWRERARDTSDAALRRFLDHKFGTSDIRFLDRYRASDVIVALEKF